ncbi:MAG: hypothetical protein FWF85_06780 [Clostridiales bacterium]|nr:hypothetical protein [Clostridiales bacterium]
MNYELCILANVLPTAEGAIALAIEESDGILADALVLIIGYGRVSQALAPRLAPLTGELCITNRGAERLELAAQAGFSVVTWADWPLIAEKATYLFNTVPDLVLPWEILVNLRPDVLIIDLAAHPGGVDFTMAKQLRKKAILASGLPGRYAPAAAGKTLARVYPPLLAAKLEERGKWDD